MKQGEQSRTDRITYHPRHRETAERLLDRWYATLRDLKPAGLSKSEDDLVTDVLRARPQSPVQFLRATLAVTTRLPPKKVRQFSREITTFLLDLNADAVQAMCVPKSHAWEQRAEGLSNEAQIRLSYRRQIGATVEDYDAAIGSGEQQLSALEAYLDAARVERAALASGAAVFSTLGAAVHA